MYQQLFGLPRWRQCKEPACQCECRIRGLGSIPGWEGSPGEGNGSPLQYSCLENPMDRGAWQAAVHWIVKSWTQLARLSIQQLFSSIYLVLTTVSLILAIISSLEMTESVSEGDFLGGPVVGNLPSNAGGTGLMPGQGTKIPEAPMRHIKMQSKIEYMRGCA